MSNSSLFLSSDGLKKIKEEEAEINGLYDDPSSYCTFGVGHLLRKSSCLLLEVAGDSEDFKALVKKKWPGKSYEVSYLDRSAAFKDKFEDLKTAAKEKGQEPIAQEKYKKKFDDLTAAEKEIVKDLVKKIVDEEARVLAKTVDDMLKEDIKPFEKAVRDKVAALVVLNQDEFDALVSLSFNIGTGNFGSSTLLKEINKNKHLSGDATARKAAIDEIEKQFRSWNKSGGVVLEGLKKRRQREADQFLQRARDELKKLEESASATPATPAAPGAPAPAAAPPPVLP